jgi:hypothetical protein
LPGLISASLIAASAAGVSPADIQPAPIEASNPVTAAVAAAVPPTDVLGQLAAAGGAHGIVLTAPAEQEPVPGRPDPAIRAEEPYGTKTFFRQAQSIPWRFGGAAAVITATGVANWKWGTAPFHFHSEGWFGKNTSNGGMDKLGHAWSSFVLTEFFTDGITHKLGESRSASYTAAVLSMSLMTYIEVFDGLSTEHGFSPEDLTVDAVGALFSVGRRAIPGLRDKLDYRLLYLPTSDQLDVLACFPRPHCERHGGTTRSVVTDYGGQRYILALKLSGFEPLKRTPLRLLELQAGYYARGFTPEDELRGAPKRRQLFVGLGLNVSQLLLGNNPRKWPGKLAKSVLEYVQVPYTAVYSD